jgi:hypothetical protein
MSRQLDELNGVLSLIIAEHRKLLVESEKHHAAIKVINVAEMELSRRRHETIRSEIAALESRRATLARQIGALHKLNAPTLTQLAQLHPTHRAKLLAQRDELRALIGQISQRTHLAGKVAGAVLGHLNTVVRLLGGAMQQAGLYTRRGLPKLAPRIGVIEAVG